MIDKRLGKSVTQRKRDYYVWLCLRDNTRYHSTNIC